MRFRGARSCSWIWCPPADTESCLGLTVTQSWNTVNVLDTKIEVKDYLTKGLKAEAVGNFLPATEKTPSYGAKLNLHYQNNRVHGRALIDFIKGPTANIDAVIGQDGYLAGGSVIYDVNKAAVTNFSAAVGYITPLYAATVIAANKLTVFTASYYHKVNKDVEAGAKATWDSKSGDHVGLELASKYRLDSASFAKVGHAYAWIHDRTDVLLRPRSTTVVLLPSPTTFSSRLVLPSVLVLRLIPRSWISLHTRLVLISSLTHKQSSRRAWACRMDGSGVFANLHLHLKYLYCLVWLFVLYKVSYCCYRLSSLQTSIYSCVSFNTYLLTNHHSGSASVVPRRSPT